MLRASSLNSGIDLNMRAIGDPTANPGPADAVILLGFAEALVTRDDAGLVTARTALAEQLGPDAVAPAAGAAGNFEMMNRILDATGVPVPRSMGAMAPELGLPVFTGR